MRIGTKIAPRAGMNWKTTYCANRRGVTTLVSIAFAAGAFGCTGGDGPQGSAGAPGTNGAQGTAGVPGPSGSAGQPGAPGIGVDGGIPVGCLSPCHGFNGVVEQWKTSTHYATAIANTGGTEVPTWTGPGPCGNCHAIDALTGRTGGNVGTVADGGVANVTKGELGYTNPANTKLSDSTYTGSSKVASVNCVTCHAVDDTNDPHRTGKIYVAGSFPFRVPTGPNDQAYIEKSPTPGSVTGQPAGKMGTSNTCVWCHKSRKDVTNYITASNTLSPYWGPHEGPQADVFSGVGGYHFAGMTYGTSTHQVKLVCADCHMPDVATNSNVPNHSFYPQVAACTQCHAGATNFDIGGGQGQMEAALTELETLLNTNGWLTRSAAPPYVALAASEIGDGNWKLDRPRANNGPGGTATVLTADQAGALYDYIIIARGGGGGVHNPKYVRQLIFDSYVAVSVNHMPPTTLVRPQ